LQFKVFEAMKMFIESGVNLQVLKREIEFRILNFGNMDIQSSLIDVKLLLSIIRVMHKVIFFFFLNLLKRLNVAKLSSFIVII
jgi:hypothetical protein